MPKLGEYLQIADAAEFLGVCKNTLRNWGTAGRIVEYRHPVNNYRLFKMADLKQLKKQIARPTKMPKPR